MRFRPIIRAMVLSAFATFVIHATDGGPRALGQDKVVALVGPRLTIKHEDGVDSVMFSPDNKTLATGCREGKIFLRDAATGKPKTVLSGYDGSVYGLAFTQDGKTLGSASQGRQGGLKLWDVEQGKLRAHLHNVAVEAVAFTPDGKFVAAAYDGLYGIFLWDAVVIKGKPKVRFEVDKNATVRSVAFSSDGKTLWSGYGDGTVTLWEAATGKSLATFQGPQVLWSVLISRDGKTLVAGGYDKESAGLIKVWDIEAKKERFAIRTPKSIYSVAYSPDNKMLATGGGDGALKLWDAATGMELATVEAHTKVIRSVAFSPNGKNLASASLDGTVKVWDVPGSK